MKQLKPYAIALLLLLATLVTTTLAGAEWIFNRPILDFDNWKIADWVSQTTLNKGFAFSLPFVGILFVHEMGHYIAARMYRTQVSLPTFIPFWVGFMPTIGTLGAVIRIRERIRSLRQFFDIGVAGPLAGFAMALVLLGYGFTHLPSLDSQWLLHPEYVPGMPAPEGSAGLGDNLLLLFFEHFVADPTLLPPRHLLIHNPFILAGYLSLFFTALNLLPIGQLDGGHVLYGLAGHRWHSILSPLLFLVFVGYAGIGIVTPYMDRDMIVLNLLIYGAGLYIMFIRLHYPRRVKILLVLAVLAVQLFITLAWPDARGYPGWLVFAFILSRFMGIYHPPALYEERLGLPRTLVAVLAIVVFILCFSPKPFVMY